tara:strand:+ start:203 stop:382 length:180 start_codon:yes stop_codon:yes gene_type:complete
MKRIEPNQESEEVGRTNKVISILKTHGHNLIIFTWLIFSQGLLIKLSIKMSGLFINIFI